MKKTIKDQGIGIPEIQSVKDEDRRQLNKWGIQECSPFEWLAWLVEEVGELAQAINKIYTDHDKENVEKMDIRKEAIQVATLSLKIARAHRKK